MYLFPENAIVQIVQVVKAEQNGFPKQILK